MDIWIVGFENGKLWCANRSPYPPTTYNQSLESAHREATLLMMKHPIKRDMSRAKIVSNPAIGFGMPRLDAPEYIDYSTERKRPIQVWVIEAPSRHYAIKIAKNNLGANLLPRKGGGMNQLEATSRCSIGSIPCGECL